MQKSNLLKAASLLLTAGAIVFGFVYLKSLYSDFYDSQVEINWYLVATSVLLFVAFYTILSRHWLAACKLVEPKVSASQKKAFLASQPYKYLPTSLFTFSFRAKYASELGLGVKKSSIAQLIENASMLSSGLLLAAMSWAVIDRPVLMIPSLFVLAAFYYLLPQKMIMNKKRFKISVEKKAGLKLFCIAFIAWVFAGLSFYTLALAAGSSIGIPEAFAANAAAYCLGILAFFAPGGIGIREGVFAFFSVSSVVILCWRLLTLVLDMLLGAITILSIKMNTKSSTS